MGRVAFADESGTSGKARCYAIGVVSVDSDKVGAFEAWIEGLKAKHRVSSELKWEQIRKGHGLINLAIELMHGLLWSRTAVFDAIVVDTRLYRKWKNRSEQREQSHRPRTACWRPPGGRIVNPSTVRGEDHPVTAPV